METQSTHHDIGMTVEELVQYCVTAGLVHSSQSTAYAQRLRSTAFDRGIKTWTTGFKNVAELGGTVETLLPRQLTEEEIETLFDSTLGGDLREAQVTS